MELIVGVIDISLIFENRLNSKFDTLCWIIDTSGNQHITWDSSKMFDTQSIKLAVSLPNGTTKCATWVGFISLSASLTLIGVLLVPNFYWNLLSVSQLNHAYTPKFTLTLDIVLYRFK